MNFRAIKSMLGITLLAVLCTACGPNAQVSLTYPKQEGSVLPAPNAPRVAVVLFSDARPHAHLGIRRDQTTFSSNLNVPEWVTRSFADALTRQGLQVSYASTAQQASAARPSYIVTGVVNQTELKEVSIAELRATIQVDVKLSGPQGAVLNEGLSASQSETGIISTGTAEVLLRNTVQELIRPGASKIAQKIMK